MPNKQVTFGDVFTYPNKPKSDSKSEAEKTVSIKNRFNCGAFRSSLNPRESQESPPPPFLWTNSRCSTTASSQYTLYNNDEDNLVNSVACEEPRECKGLRKNLSGKWRRLVKRKPPQEVYTLPAELRDQLETIYVY